MSEFTPGEEVLFTCQRHEARKVGLHWDYRVVVGDKVYPWTTEKEMPEAGLTLQSSGTKHGYSKSSLKKSVNKHLDCAEGDLNLT